MPSETSSRIARNTQLIVFATALLIASLVFLVTIIALNRRISAIQRSGIQVSSMLMSREARAVYINDMEFSLTEAAIETLSVLAEARLDDEVMTGVQIEALFSCRSEADCEEAAGATRAKRLRDSPPRPCLASGQPRVILPTDVPPRRRHLVGAPRWVQQFWRVLDGLHDARCHDPAG